jgi:hypothetical protein
MSEVHASGVNDVTNSHVNSLSVRNVTTFNQNRLKTTDACCLKQGGGVGDLALDEVREIREAAARLDVVVADLYLQGYLAH